MDGNEACLQCHAAMREPTLTAHTKHQAGFDGQLLLQLPHAVHDVRPAESAAKPSDQQPDGGASVQTGRPNACNLCHLDKTLAWTSDYLEKLVRNAEAPLIEDEQTIAASLLWLLRGRCRPARAGGLEHGMAAGAAGLGHELDGALPAALLLDDPYDAVRFIAFRSLRSLPGFAGFKYDFVSPPSERFAATVRALDNWRRTRRPEDRRTDRELLFNAGGLPDVDLITRLLRQRNDRRVVLRE